MSMKRADHTTMSEGVRRACALVRSRLPHGYSPFLFGSRARGTSRARSDWDIAIVGPSPLPWTEFSVLKLDAQEEAWPYTIDIVDINRAPAAIRDAIVEDMVPLEGV